MGEVVGKEYYVEYLNLPREIQDKMLERQKGEQGGSNARVFITNIVNQGLNGGFDWFLSKEGYDFWEETLSINGDYDLFYREYPLPR
jgi:hypothetical protein